MKHSLRSFIIHRIISIILVNIHSIFSLIFTELYTQSLVKDKMKFLWRSVQSNIHLTINPINYDRMYQTFIKFVIKAKAIIFSLERVLGLMNLSLKEIWYISPSRILRFQKTINITLKIIIVIEGPLVKMWWLGILKSPFFLVHKNYPLVWMLVIIEYTKNQFTMFYLSY